MENSLGNHTIHMPENSWNIYTAFPEMGHREYSIFVVMSYNYNCYLGMPIHLASIHFFDLLKWCKAAEQKQLLAWHQR